MHYTGIVLNNDEIEYATKTLDKRVLSKTKKVRKTATIGLKLLEHIDGLNAGMSCGHPWWAKRYWTGIRMDSAKGNDCLICTIVRIVQDRLRLPMKCGHPFACSSERLLTVTAEQIMSVHAGGKDFCTVCDEIRRKVDDVRAEVRAGLPQAIEEALAAHHRTIRTCIPCRDRADVGLKPIKCHQFGCENFVPVDACQRAFEDDGLVLRAPVPGAVVDGEIGPGNPLFAGGLPDDYVPPGWNE